LKPLFILLLTLAGFAVMGYHPGLEDDGVYLSAVKARLNPALYPHDADFIRLQLQATIFDNFMAGFIRITHIPVPWAELLWQFISLYIILWAAHGIAQMLFSERRSAWAGVALLSAMFTLPVAGTAINIADQHLHPRNLATGLILLGVERMLAGKRWQTIGLLAMAVIVHPIMGAFGISFCVFLGLALTRSVYEWLSSRIVRRPDASVLGAFPLSWVFEAPTPEWRRALNTRTYFFLYQWRWYEWLGAIGPLVLFGLLWVWSAEQNPSGAKALPHSEALAARLKSCPDTKLSSGLLLRGCTMALLLYGAFQQMLAMILPAAPALVRLTPLQPMRYLHLEYVFLVLIAGGLLGRHLLHHRIWRWTLFLVAVNGGMFLSQRLLLPASDHLELPGRAPSNQWLQAFAWIRENTPPDAHFALDPNYLAAPGEDYHSFRALAERSQLADALKDAAVVTQVPELGRRWAEQVDAQAGWNRFQLKDFERLKMRCGVDWGLLSYPPPPRLICRWHNHRLAVCRIDDSAASPGQ
jgi:hypothetical protein